MHTLVNMTRKEIMIMERSHDHVCCFLYTPGFKAQEDVRRAQFKAMFKGENPPFLMILDSNHFSAVVPCDCNNPKTNKRSKASKKKGEEGSSSSTAIDIDD